MVPCTSGSGQLAAAPAPQVVPGPATAWSLETQLGKMRPTSRSEEMAVGQKGRDMRVRGCGQGESGRAKWEEFEGYCIGSIFWWSPALCKGSSVL